MADPLLLPLARCTDPSLAGGKAAGLARLLSVGFLVPAGTEGVAVNTPIAMRSDSIRSNGGTRHDNVKAKTGSSGFRIAGGSFSIST